MIDSTLKFLNQLQPCSVMVIESRYESNSYMVYKWRFQEVIEMGKIQTLTTNDKLATMQWPQPLREQTKLE